MQLKERTALVTGAARRIGREIALRLASLGCHIIIHYHTSRDESEQVSDEIKTRGCDCLTIQADLSDQDGCHKLAQKAIDWHGKVDILVNSAAIFPSVSFEQIVLSDWQSVFSTNLLAGFWLAQQLGPEMVKRGEGKIINIADISADSPWKDYLPYCVSKAAVISLSAGLAKLLAPAVQVNTIGPGPILFPEDFPEILRQRIVQKTLLQRQGGATDIADAVELFCRNDYMTGVFLPVDGGLSVR